MDFASILWLKRMQHTDGAGYADGMERMDVAKCAVCDD